MKELKFQQNGIFSEQILDALPDLIFVIDNQHQILYANSAATEAFGVNQSELLATHCYTWVHGTTEPPVFCPQTKTLQDMCTHMVDSLLERLERNFWVTTSPLFDQQGMYVASLHVARDITERVRMEEQLRKVSVEDALTGIFNRAWFEAEVTRIENGRVSPVSVIMADVDKLKKMNDIEGHSAGDDLLRRAAMLLKTCCRQADGVARIGGDEFAVLLPGVDTANVGILLTRIRKQLAKENASAHRPLSLSLGAATTDTPQQLKETLRLADKRMYKDKVSKKTVCSK